MYHIEDPEEMTPEERFKEVAAILAKGFLRLKRRGPGVIEPLSQAPNKADSLDKRAQDSPGENPRS